MGRKLLDLQDARFGHLVAKELLPEPHVNGERIWLCKCDCGKEVKAATGKLRSGKKWHCGCLGKGLASPIMAYEPNEKCKFCEGHRCEILTEMFCATKGKCKFFVAWEAEENGQHDD